jgi:hypothetical protein
MATSFLSTLELLPRMAQRAAASTPCVGVHSSSHKKNSETVNGMSPMALAHAKTAKFSTVRCAFAAFVASRLWSMDLKSRCGDAL